MAEVPRYVAPIVPAKTFGEAVLQGTSQLGPVLAQDAKMRLDRQNARRKQKNEQLKEIKGYDVSNWADTHIDAYDELKLKTEQLINAGDPRASMFLDNLIRYGDKFDSFAKETMEDRERFESGIVEPGSLNTDELEFVGNEIKLAENDVIRDRGGFSEFDITEDGRILGNYLDSNGVRGDDRGDVFDAPGISEQNYYNLDYQPFANMTPQMFAEDYIATANELVNSNVPADEIYSRIEADMLKNFDASGRAQSSAKSMYEGLNPDVIDLKKKYVDEAMQFIGTERLASRAGGSAKQLSVDVIENRTRAEISQEELQQYGEFSNRLGPERDAVGQNYVMTELEKGKGLDLPNPEYDPLYKESTYDDASKIRLKKAPIVNEKVRTIQVFPEMGMLVIKGGLKGEYRINYEQPNEQEQDILEQLRQAMNEAYEGELTLEMLFDPDRAIRNVSYFQGQAEQQPAAAAPQPQVNNDPLGIR